MPALALLLAACTAAPPEKPETSGLPPTTTTSPPGTIPAVTEDTTTTLANPDECGGDPDCTNLWALPYHWTVEGWVGELHLADLDGDGIVDALLQAEIGGEYRAFVVSGPLERDVHLPDDADAELVGAIDAMGDLEPVGDFDGDGDVDLAAGLNANGERTVYPGPFAGEVDFHALAPVGWIPRGYVVDLDGDGDAEVLHVESGIYEGRTRVEVFDGPYDPVSAPLMTIDSLCDDGDYEYYASGAWDPEVVLRPTDVDGDGVLDLALASWHGCDEGSGAFTVSGAARGDVDEGSPGVLFGGPAMAVGDVDGDGTADAYLSDDWGWVDEAVLAGPLAPTSELLGVPATPVDGWGLYPLGGGRVLSVGWGVGASVVLYDGLLTGAALERWPLGRDRPVRYFPEDAPGLVLIAGHGGVAIAVIEP